MVKYPLTGGLQLTSVKPLVTPGSLQECLNFEVATYGGYSRIGGLARFDGSEDVGALKLWRLKFTGTNNFAAGTQAWFDPALKGWIMSTTIQDGIHVVYLMVPGVHPAPGLPDTLTDGTNSATIMSRDAVFEATGTQANFNTGYATIESGQRSRIGVVPGRQGSDIIGGFFYKDRVYAVRDLPRIAFEDGYYTDADEGKYLTFEGYDYKILDVAITGYQQGIITYDTEPGTGTLAVPIGAANLVALPVTGDLPEGWTGIAYFGDLDVSGGIPPYSWEVTGDDGVTIEAIEAPDASELNFLPQLTNAALYRSGSAGWERAALGREMRFSAGTTGINNFMRSADLSDATVLSTAAMYPTVGLLNGAASSDMGSDNTTYAALASGNVVNDFMVSGFDFSAVPLNADIVGIEVKFERYSDAGAKAIDSLVTLTGIGTAAANKARGEQWQTAPTIVTYGGENDLWECPSIDAAVVRDPDFGVHIHATRAAVGTPATGGIDYVTVKVFYIEKDPQIFIWDGATDVEMTLHHTQITTGDPALSTAEGFMNVTADTNADKTRLVNHGDQIRTAAAGAGTLLGTVAARDKPIWLAGQAEIDINRSRYMFERANFYGQDEFEAVYGVCGASPAFSYDGTRCIRIRTQLPHQRDLPRHVAKHGEMLTLGFFSGAIVFSKPGDPHEMRASHGASGVEVGDRLTGLSPMPGDALGVICQTRTELIRGLTPDVVMKSPVNAKRGGIEYTSVDMGRIVLCDGLGIFLADTPESFGAAERNYISQSVHPWLSPRLQARISSESASLRPVCALNVRNKNQMRLYFWDGWCLTMTLNEPPEFTTQRYYTPAANEHAEPTPWVPRMICSGIDSSGRERLFCSFYGGIKEGYVFEMDAGRSFDGDPIPAYITCNPLTVDSASREKKHDRFHLYGLGLGWASVTSSRSINDSETFNGSFAFNMGRADSRAKLSTVPFRGVVDSPVEAFDVSLRFDSNSSSQGIFTLQYVELVAESRGQTRGKQGSGG